MSLQDTVFDLDAAIVEQFGEDSNEHKLFEEIVNRLWQYEALLDDWEQKLTVLDDFRALLQGPNKRNT